MKFYLHHLFITISHVSKYLQVYSQPRWCYPKKRSKVLFLLRRRIVIAELQHVVYSEWLPEILGPSMTAKLKLDPLKSGYTKYDASVDASIPNECSAAFLRFGHLLVNDSFLR